MKSICTICSRRKREDEGLLPARERYVSEHVQATGKIADESGLPFFILSGKYGLIPADKEILNYDYYLEDSAVDALAEVVRDQLKEYGITELVFYAEDKASWAPYALVLQKGTALAGVSLTVLPF